MPRNGNGLVFDYRAGRSIKGLQPQVVGEELERIREARGSLTPEIVLEEATAEESPLHGAFTWSDDEAARRYRIHEARRIVTSIRVLNGPAAKPSPAFISVRTPERGREYLPISTALSEHELKVRVLAEAKQMVETLERRWSHFAEVADVLQRLRQATG
jgi:hypothetical protein